MKVALARPYRTWISLLPTTFGAGIAALRQRSLSCPLSIDADGLNLGHHRKLPWTSIKKIGISRSYLDGYINEMRIHHRGGVSKISVLPFSVVRVCPAPNFADPTDCSVRACEPTAACPSM